MQPEQEPKVFNDSNDVVTALKQGQVDAAVFDLPTAFYVTAAQVPNSTIVGQFSAPGGDSFGLLLEKDSELTECVNDGLARLRESGELERITNRWMGEAAGAPELR
jgi:polar amino acid transport system substrate-binding protein